MSNLLVHTRRNVSIHSVTHTNRLPKCGEICRWFSRVDRGGTTVVHLKKHCPQFAVEQMQPGLFSLEACFALSRILP